MAVSHQRLAPPARPVRRDIEPFWDDWLQVDCELPGADWAGHVAPWQALMAGGHWAQASIWGFSDRWELDNSRAAVVLNVHTPEGLVRVAPYETVILPKYAAFGACVG